jgi:hypothetical protein
MEKCGVLSSRYRLKVLSIIRGASASKGMERETD